MAVVVHPLAHAPTVPPVQRVNTRAAVVERAQARASPAPHAPVDNTTLGVVELVQADARHALAQRVNMCPIVVA